MTLCIPSLSDLLSAIKPEHSYHAEDDDTHGAGHGSDSDDDQLGGAWDRTYHDENHDEFLFGAGSSKTNVELSTLHPEQMQIIRLWQIYLDNVNPLLKITHSPTLQARILDAVGDLRAISPEFEALIFGIYCVSVLSLTGDECLRLFSSPKNHLLSGYQFACRQALLKCKVLRTNSRDCLTALFLYLVRRAISVACQTLGYLFSISSCKRLTLCCPQVSVAYDTHPRSMSSMLAVAVHIAQRMGIHMERTFATHSALEAEMCRRLWWSLVTFNHRICELTEYRTTPLMPAWDCRMPSNLHDFEIRPEAQTASPAHEEPTEALFTVLRYQHADILRHSAVHLSFANPYFNTIARPDNSSLTALERLIEDKYSNSSDSANPLYFITIWTARASLARSRLLEHYSMLASSEGGQQQQQPGVPQRNDESSVSHALRMLECDAKLLRSPLVRGYAWFVRLHFPMLAYVHVLRYLRGCPSGGASCRAWRVLGESYEAHAAEPKLADAIFVVCSRLVLQAWEAREAEMTTLQREKPGSVMEVPRIVSDMRDKAEQLDAAAASTGGGNLAQPAVPVSMDWGCQGLPGVQSSGYNDVSQLDTFGLEMNQFWDTFD